MRNFILISTYVATVIHVGQVIKGKVLDKKREWNTGRNSVPTSNTSTDFDGNLSLPKKVMF
jgi:hypothetical protein